MIFNLINGQYIDLATVVDFISDVDENSTLQMNAYDITLQFFRPGLKFDFLDGGRSLVLYRSDISSVELSLI
jgi:hypothetical protein